jgi:hypothetical protein
MIIFDETGDREIPSERPVKAARIFPVAGLTDSSSFR